MSEAPLLPTILLVEDEKTDADLLRRAFAKAKVLNPIVLVSNGDEALAYLTATGKYSDRMKYPLPALILLDLKLPGLTGIQLLQWRRTQSHIKRIPVVVLTIDGSHATIEAAYDLGANSYLVKPGHSDEVTRMVQTIQSYWIEMNEAPQLVMATEQ
jgi:CheY-like chemotaxis protein